MITARDVAEITRLLEESSFDELYLEADGLKLSLKRGSTAQSESKPAEASGASAPEAEAGDPAIHKVTAPLLGTFYRAPKPGAQPFVDVGAQVEIDSIIGIIEVMKLMNTVRAGVRGTVIEVLAQDGTLVEYGQVLLRVGKAS
ncbi:MAG TPA: acetyl-CoA carboxylase [Burkholderiaceae bacterium]|nr:acetyl-CoA carboxylase [Burkholderiaceae bacterium]